MNRLVVALLLLSSLPAWPQPLSFEKEFEVKLCPSSAQLAAPVQGDPGATMALVQQIYQLTGPKLGCRFVEPSYLLCLADLRPYTSNNGFMTDPQPQDEDMVDRLNRFLVPRGFSLHPKQRDAQGRVNSFSLHSLEGLDRRTRETHLSWIPRYRRETGWAGYYQWKRDIWKNMPDREVGYDRVEGVMLGYPDAAVDGYSEDIARDPACYVDAYLPQAYHYDGGLPIFRLPWQAATDAGVMAQEREWNTFLSQAYATPQHQALEQQVEFRQQRVRRWREQSQPDRRCWEWRRWGLEYLEPPPAPLDSDLERWGNENASKVAQVLAENADLVQAAEACGNSRLRSLHLWSWLMRGLCQPQSPAGELWQTYLRHHPASARELLQQELSRRARDPRPAGLQRMLSSSQTRALWPDLDTVVQKEVLKAAHKWGVEFCP